MPELVSSALPFLGPVLLPALFLLLAPLCGRRARTVMAAILIVIGLGFTADALILDHSHPDTLQVPNVFPRGPQAEPHVWVTDTVTAPAWHWHLCMTAILLLPGLVLLARRNRTPQAPSPVLHGAGVFLFYLLARLALERTAAPRGLVWAFGATPALLLILPFFAWYCGRRGATFGGLARGLLGLALLQRLPLIAIGYVATTGRHGTHLDTHVVTDMHLQPFGEMQFDGGITSWVYPTLVPHLTLWIVVTVVAGLVLGTVPLLLARRRAASGKAA